MKKSLIGLISTSAIGAVLMASFAAAPVAQAATGASSTGRVSTAPSQAVAGTLTVTNPGTKTGRVGTAISPFTIAASGGTSPYTFTSTGLPPGLSISSGGTVSGTPATRGSYSATVNVKDFSSPQKTGSTTFAFTVTGGSTSCSAPGQMLGNPGFESGARIWTQSSGFIGQWTGPGAPRSGTWDAWLNGYGVVHIDTLSQNVVIPAGCTGTTLSFYLHVDSSETTTTQKYDTLVVAVGGTTVAAFSNLDKASGYSLRTAKLGSFAGQTVTLKFTGTEDKTRQTSFAIDDVAVNAT